MFEGRHCVKGAAVRGTHSKDLDVGVGVHAEGRQSAAVLLQDHMPGTPTALIL